MMVQSAVEPSMLFRPFEFRQVFLRNRIVMPPMCQWLSTPEGHVGEYHIVHYGQRAVAGVGMIIVEATAVEARGRITGRDLGIWSDEQVVGLGRLASVISEFGAVPAIQLGHAGRKAWKDGPGVIGPSAVAFSDQYPVPTEMSRQDIDDVVDSFASAARRAVGAGFKVLELHAAHGYLLHQFLSPLSNRRTDEYGGSFENRLRFPLSVVRAVRQAIPDSIGLMVRVSAVEYDPRGYSLQDMVSICRAFKEAGADIIHVSSGGSIPLSPPSWPGYQLEFARTIREGARMPVIGVGKLEAPELAEFALRSGFCDLVAVGREMLRDPNWPSRAALTLGHQVPVVEPLRPVFQPPAS